MFPGRSLGMIYGIMDTAVHLLIIQIMVGIDLSDGHADCICMRQSFTKLVVIIYPTSMQIHRLDCLL